MEGLPSAKTIKFEFLQLGQTLLSRPSFCNEKLLAKAAVRQYSSKKKHHHPLIFKHSLPMQENIGKAFYFNNLKIQ
jgi:hypothetical protein